MEPTHSTVLSYTSCPITELRDKYRKDCIDLVISVLTKNDFNKSVSARELGLNRTTLIEFLRRHIPHLVGEPNVKKETETDVKSATL